MKHSHFLNIKTIHFARRVILILNLFCTALAVNGQEIVKHFSINDGLPSLEVYYVHCDVDGYLWFCTDRGISRYNGYEFENFTTQDGLTHNIVFKVFEDAKNNLWFTCMDGSIFIRNYASKKFEAFDHNAELKARLGSYNWIQSIFFSEDDMFLFSERNCEGVYKYDFNECKLRAHQEYQVNHYRDKFDLKSVAIKSPIKETLDRTHYLVRIDSACFSKYSFEEICASFYRAFSNVTNVKLYKEVEGVSFYGDVMAASTRHGLNLWREGKTFARFLENVIVSATAQDQEGNIWVTTANRGVFVVSINDIKSKVLSRHMDDGDRITTIDSINGHLVVGTNLGRIIDVKEHKLLFNDPMNDGSLKFFSHEEDHLVYYFESHSLAISPDQQSLKVNIDKPVFKNNFYHYTFHFPFLRLAIDEDSHFRFGPGWFGWVKADDTPGFTNMNLNHACIGFDQQVYYCSRSDLYVVKDMQFQSPMQLTSKMGLEGVTVRRLYFTKDSLLVMSTLGGGLIIAKNEKVIARIGKQEGLASEMVNACYVDLKNNRFWCATNRGVSIVDYTYKNGVITIDQVINLDQTNGLPSSYVHEIKGFGDQVWTACEQSLASIPKNFRPPQVAPPPVHIVSIINEEKDYLDSIPTFHYYQNDIEIHFVAISIQRPVDKKFYRYRLVSSSSDQQTWSYTSDRGIGFKNLDADDYQFEVSAKSQNSNWSEPKVLAFTIAPFFWDRLPVRIALICIFLLVAFLFFRWYVLGIKQKNMKVMEMNDLKFENHQLELASLRGQMNPHFTFNVLNSIQNLILKGSKWEANTLLIGFSKLIRSSLEYSRLDYIPLHKELNFLENYLNIEKRRDLERFDFKLEVSNQTEMEDLLIPTLLIQPICENAIKHAFVSGKGSLEIYIRKLSEETIEVKTIDNGIGYFNAPKKHRATQNSLGLSIIKSRLDIFKQQGLTASLTISPTHPQSMQGTIVTLILPCK